MYVNMIFQRHLYRLFRGDGPYCVASTMGPENRGELRGLLRRSGGLLAVCGGVHAGGGAGSGRAAVPAVCGI